MDNSDSFILERKLIELKELQLKMLASSWGKDSIDGTVVESITYISDGLKVRATLLTRQILRKNILE